MYLSVLDDALHCKTTYFKGITNLFLQPFCKEMSLPSLLLLILQHIVVNFFFC
jgi:hypothetical protein